MDASSRRGGQRLESLVLAADDIQRIMCEVGVDSLMDTFIASLEEALVTFSPESFRIPVRDGFNYTVPTEGLLEWMPAMNVGGHATLKIVGYHPNNPATQTLPTILSTALTFDTKTGQLLGIADATLLTAMRTGAASAVASRCLALPSSRNLGLIGCGAQAVTQLHALSRVMEFDRVLLFDSDRSASESFAGRVSMLTSDELSIELSTIDELVSAADIICTATSVSIGGGPVFVDAGLKNHVHVNAIGSDFPGKTELPRSLLQRALVCPDFAGQAVKEGESQQIDSKDMGPDLTTLVKNAGQYAAAQNRETVFDSTGWALEDHVVAEIMFGYANELGCGQWIDIEIASDDPKNPYGFIAKSVETRSDTGSYRRWAAE